MQDRVYKVLTIINFMGIKNVVMGIGIVILTIFVTMYGINTIYPAPEYGDFCETLNKQLIPPEREVTTEYCTEEAMLCPDGSYVGRDPKNNCEFSQCIDNSEQIRCREEYETAQEKHSKYVFLISLPLGILIIIIGASLFTLEAVGAGLMGGGVGTLIFGVGGYWRYSDDVLKFILSLIGLIVLIWFSYWINKQTHKKSWKKKLKKIF